MKPTYLTLIMSLLICFGCQTKPSGDASPLEIHSKALTTQNPKRSEKPSKIAKAQTELIGASQNSKNRCVDDGLFVHTKKNSLPKTNPKRRVTKRSKLRTAKNFFHASSFSKLAITVDLEKKMRIKADKKTVKMRQEYDLFYKKNKEKDRKAHEEKLINEKNKIFSQSHKQ